MSNKSTLSDSMRGYKGRYTVHRFDNLALRHPPHVREFRDRVRVESSQRVNSSRPIPHHTTRVVQV